MGEKREKHEEAKMRLVRSYNKHEACARFVTEDETESVKCEIPRRKSHHVLGYRLSYLKILWGTIVWLMGEANGGGRTYGVV